MNILNNALGALGLSQGNLIRNAMKFVGLPEGLSAGVGLIMDVKNGNIGSALFKTGPALLKALTGGQAGQANSTDRPSGIFGTLGKVAGFAALGAVALGAAPLVLGAGGALAGLGGGLKGMLGIAAGLGFGAVAMKALGGAGGFGFDKLMGFQSSEFAKFTGQTRTNQGIGSDSLVAKLKPPVAFEDLIAAFMVDFVKDKQKEIEGKLDKLRKSAANAEGGSGAEGGIRGFFGGIMRNIPLVGGLFGAGQDNAKSGSSESRNIEFEMLKNEMQKLSQMQQAMSNVLNEMHNLAMNAVRNLKG